MRSGNPRPRRVAIVAFWSAIFLVWLLLLAIYLPGVLDSGRKPGVSSAEQWALAGIGIGSSVIWLAGIRHLAMWLLTLAPAPRAPLPRPSSTARVALLYCTADDLNPDALRRSARQDRPVSVFILDDSSSPDRRAEIDELAETEGFTVLRRRTRTGYKAGNLNAALKRLIADFDYFVVLDSDEIIPQHFASRALAHFGSDPSIGIVQGRHRAVPGTTAFAAVFAGMLESHVTVVQQARSRMGFSAFMGRGAMISAQCLREAGPIPEVVTEDVAFSLEARLAGFRIHYDNDLVSIEEYPVDYHAFRTQHAKTVEGTTEFMARSWRRILRSRLDAGERIDLLVEQLTAPAMAAAAVLCFSSGVVLTALGGEAVQPIWSILATGALGASVLLPEAVRVARLRGALAGAGWLAAATALFASTLLLTLRATLKVLFGGRAVFAVTPKSASRDRDPSTLRPLRSEAGGVVTVVAIALLLSGSIAPALPVLGSGVAALLFAMVGARPLAAVRRPRRLAAAPNDLAGRV